MGAGPAGARAAELLASAGHQIRLFDSQGPWEKPCGGGITTRTLLLGGAIPEGVPQQEIESVRLYYGDATSVSLTPQTPLSVVSRKELGDHLLASAISAGAIFVRDRVVELESSGAGWRVGTRDGSFEADTIVGADGTTSFVRRRMTGAFEGEDLSVTLGYFISGETSSVMKIFFVPELEGYLWSFPRPDHISYGLITRPGPHWTSRGKALLENFIVADMGPEAMHRATFYSAPVPCLRYGAWETNLISGGNWALLGDAAGLADPITGEGIYHAVRSAELLAEAFPNLSKYAQAVQQYCVSDLSRAAQLYPMFYTGRFLGATFRKRLVQFARSSPTIRRHLGALLSGTQPYRGLRRKLLKSAPRVAVELIGSRFGWLQA